MSRQDKHILQNLLSMLGAKVDCANPEQSLEIAWQRIDRAAEVLEKLLGK